MNLTLHIVPKAEIDTIRSVVSATTESPPASQERAFGQGAVMMGWTDDRVAVLRKLWTDGLSASQIAKQLGGVTRNAVIGKVHRLGLAGRATPSRPAKRPVRHARPAPRPVSNTTNALQQRPRPPMMAVVNGPPPIEALRLPDGSVANVLTLKETMCKWPIGDPNDMNFAFCGRGACNGPYCSEHAQLAYQPQQQRKKRAFGEPDELRRMMRYASA